MTLKKYNFVTIPKCKKSQTYKVDLLDLAEWIEGFAFCFTMVKRLKALLVQRVLKLYKPITLTSV